MSGVRVGTRLDQLRVLRRQTKHQLDSARNHARGHDAQRLQALLVRVDDEIASLTAPPPKPQGVPRGKHQKATDRVTRRLDQLGVTAHDVKTWAVTVGLVDRVRRGRVHADLVDAYAARQGPT